MISFHLLVDIWREVYKVWKVEGDEVKGWVPAYHFAICNNKGIKMGVCDLRIGHNDKLYYGGSDGITRR